MEKLNIVHPKAELLYQQLGIPYSRYKELILAVNSMRKSEAFIKKSAAEQYNGILKICNGINEYTVASFVFTSLTVDDGIKFTTGTHDDKPLLLTGLNTEN